MKMQSASQLSWTRCCKIPAVPLRGKISPSYHDSLGRNKRL